MDKIKVLMAEDETALAHIVRESLEERNFEVVLCADGEQALKKFATYKADVLVLDVMMPKMDGFEVAKKIRESDRVTPIIFLTARSQPKDVVMGFETGGNDYLKKPFSVEELIVRIKVLLSKDRLLSNPKTIKRDKNETIAIGSFVFKPNRNIIEQGMSTHQLTARESEVLKILCEHQQETLTRQKLLTELWGDDNFFNARSLDVFITKLRKHLKADPSVQIINIRGVGYKLVW
ncbi:DNA-binding response OmpR family regulator [Mucilaginibacter gracilis]|uniref:DNA-binding response OmpR family regulator n=1 Tax=Mucilaginibacter gracilis TaxID=423350 RepID=A0A495IX05_9SPHI|nr:response regulator transcription factor [Mucilaginibacter gracilis]RKR81266.1 DNA-binding response OmpR family regulator [Mucilaginibacter gracilis]